MMQFSSRSRFILRLAVLPFLLLTLLTLFLSHHMPSVASAAVSNPAGELPPPVPTTVYTTVNRAGCFALDARTGKIKWQFPRSTVLSAVGESSLTGLVYFTELLTADGSFYALNEQTGALVWRSSVGNIRYPTTPVITTNNLVYFGNNEYLYALDARTGAFVWRYKATASVATRVLATFQNVYFGATDGSFYALNALNGAFVWRYQGAATGVPTVPTGAPGLVYIGVGPYLYALNDQTGASVWKFQAPSAITTSAPRAIHQQVYIGTSSGSLYALNWTSGAIVWMKQLTTSDISIGPPYAIEDGSNIVVVGDSNRQLYALNWDTGTTLWHKQLANSVMAQVALAGGAVYASAYPQPLYKLDVTTGASIWTFAPTSGSLGTTPLVQ